jgi:SpoVK/Ycf46/Vps4 family AAA+-type ATPase
MAMVQPINGILKGLGRGKLAGTGAGKKEARAGGGASDPSFQCSKRDLVRADAQPAAVDPSISFRDVGGLDSHVRALKEMVTLPLLYPELFERFSVRPPRGVLFHGPPGTGKTLMARALANSCTVEGRRVSFFAVKGAQLLSKWLGESERQLRIIFEQARRLAPSIIFFDEIDGIAPVRSSKQDQIHASIVSTLLALMDGLDDRGAVVVIGATNRPDAIDPALRRPQRFDRELYFPLPSAAGRRAILDIKTQRWSPPLTAAFKNALARATVGYCGADLAALCSEAALRAVRRRLPQIYASDAKLVVDPSAITITLADFASAMRDIVPAAARSSQGFAVPVPAHLTPLIRPLLMRALRALKKTFPFVQPAALLLDADAAAEPGATVLALTDGFATAVANSSAADASPRAGLSVSSPAVSASSQSATEAMTKAKTAASAEADGDAALDYDSDHSEAMAAVYGNSAATSVSVSQVAAPVPVPVAGAETDRQTAVDVSVGASDSVPMCSSTDATHGAVGGTAEAAVCNAAAGQSQARAASAVHALNVDAILASKGQKTCHRPRIALFATGHSDPHAPGQATVAVTGASTVWGKASPPQRGSAEMALAFADDGVATIIAQALLHACEGTAQFAIDMPSLLSDSHARSPAEALSLRLHEARRSAPSIVYLPRADEWWAVADEQLRATLVHLLDSVPSDLPLLLLSTLSGKVAADAAVIEPGPDDLAKALPEGLARVILAGAANFPGAHGTRTAAAVGSTNGGISPLDLGMVSLPNFSSENRRAFFAQIWSRVFPKPSTLLFPSSGTPGTEESAACDALPLNLLDEGVVAIVRRRQERRIEKRRQLEAPLTVAPPPPPPPPPSEEDLDALREKENVHLRELRYFLRTLVDELSRNPKYRPFSNPVDPEDVPDYYEIVRQPLDLGTISDKINDGAYATYDLFRADLERIHTNALTYNPLTFKDFKGKKLVRAAAALIDEADLRVKEFDRRLGGKLLKRCRKIYERRKLAGEVPHPDKWLTWGYPELVPIPDDLQALSNAARGANNKSRKRTRYTNDPDSVGTQGAGTRVTRGQATDGSFVALSLPDPTRRRRESYGSVAGAKAGNATAAEAAGDAVVTISAESSAVLPTEAQTGAIEESNAIISPLQSAVTAEDELEDPRPAKKARLELAEGTSSTGECDMQVESVVRLSQEGMTVTSGAGAVVDSRDLGLPEPTNAIDVRPDHQAIGFAGEMELLRLAGVSYVGLLYRSRRVLERVVGATAGWDVDPLERLRTAILEAADAFGRRERLLQRQVRDVAGSGAPEEAVMETARASFASGGDRAVLLDEIERILGLYAGSLPKNY